MAADGAVGAPCLGESGHCSGRGRCSQQVHRSSGPSPGGPAGKAHHGHGRTHPSETGQRLELHADGRIYAYLDDPAPQPTTAQREAHDRAHGQPLSPAVGVPSLRHREVEQLVEAHHVGPHPHNQRRRLALVRRRHSLIRRRSLLRFRASLIANRLPRLDASLIRRRSLLRLRASLIANRLPRLDSSLIRRRSLLRLRASLIANRLPRFCVGLVLFGGSGVLGGLLGPEEALGFGAQRPRADFRSSRRSVLSQLNSPSRPGRPKWP